MNLKATSGILLFAMAAVAYWNYDSSSNRQASKMNEGDLVQCAKEAQIRITNAKRFGAPADAIWPSELKRCSSALAEMHDAGAFHPLSPASSPAATGKEDDL